MKKILIVGQHFWPENFRINDIADYFTENNIEVDVLCGIPNYPKGSYYRKYGMFKRRKEIHNDIKITRAFEIPRGNNSNIKIFLNYMSFPFFSIFHIPKLLFNKYDKVFIYQLSPVMMSISGILISKIRKIESTMYVLDMWPDNLYSVINVKNKFAKKILHNWSVWHYKHVDKLIVLSNRMKDTLIQRGVDENRITIIPQSCEKIYENKVFDKKLSSRFKNTFNVVFTGNISPAQSLETLVSAAKILVKKIPNICFVIVGDGMSKKQIEELVSQHNLSDYFVFEGQVDISDIPKYTYIADMLVGCLVKSELLEATIPAKVMSYIASGKPIALAMDGEVQGLINNEIKCGYVGSAGNHEALAENILKIFKLSAIERKKMGDLAFTYHMKYFERNIILNKLTNFIFS
jgi:glycosyltransferase involved in cell wall biosynthesis